MSLRHKSPAARQRSRPSRKKLHSDRELWWRRRRSQPGERIELLERDNVRRVRTHQKSVERRQHGRFRSSSNRQLPLATTTAKCRPHAAGFPRWPGTTFSQRLRIRFGLSGAATVAGRTFGWCAAATVLRDPARTCCLVATTRRDSEHAGNDRLQKQTHAQTDRDRPRSCSKVRQNRT